MDRVTARRELGVPADATADQVRDAFRRHARGNHPDTGGSRERFETLMSARNLLLAPRQPPRLIVTHRPSLLQQALDFILAVTGLSVRSPGGSPGRKRSSGRVQ